MGDVKMKILLDLMPESLNKEPVQVVWEVMQLLGSFRDIMRQNFGTTDVEKIQQRWCACRVCLRFGSCADLACPRCCGDGPWLTPGP